MELKERVEQALDKARTFLRADGGDVELVEVTDENIVRVRLTGACGGCPMATMTLKNGIERIVRQDIPEIKEVQSV